MTGNPDLPPETARLFEAAEATWPPARATRSGPWTIREGRGGGKRVSAATAQSTASTGEIASAEAAMQALDQTPLFLLRDGDEALDGALQTHGYRVIDPVNIYACPTERLLAIPRPRVSGFTIWEPLAIMKEIWEAGGIGKGRVDVMRRAAGPKTGILGRASDGAAGTAFVATHDGIAILHALEVAQDFRRSGLGRTIMGHAGHWAARQGAETFAVLVTKDNVAANGLYASLGMTVAGDYFYRIR